MKSPFPGMDPFIEACGLWEGFHNRLVHRIDDFIAQALPRGYTVDVGVRTYIVLVQAKGKEELLAKPDVGITDLPGGRKPSRKNSGVALAEPHLDDDSLPMEAFLAEKFEEAFVEIYAVNDERQLVACIEVLSPANKRPSTEGWRESERKRQAMLLGRAHFVELDLLRGGRKPPMLTPWPKCPYTLLVSRQERAPHCRVWPASFQRRLPPIPIPLLDPDPDLTLDLQPLIDDIYSLGRYDERLDYGRALSPRLTAAEAAWVREQLKGRSSQPPRKRRRG